MIIMEGGEEMVDRQRRVEELRITIDGTDAPKPRKPWRDAETNLHADGPVTVATDKTPDRPEGPGDVGYEEVG
jgi:hypothetical protein